MPATSRELISLLSERNHCLQRLLDLSTAFRASADRDGLSALPEFRDRRAELFRKLNLCERGLSNLVSDLPASWRTPEAAAAVERELRLRESLTRRILESDGGIMELISAERSSVLGAIASIRRCRVMMSRFKSGRMGGLGEELDRKL